MYYVENEYFINKDFEMVCLAEEESIFKVFYTDNLIVLNKKNLTKNIL